MKNLELQEFGVQEMNMTEMNETDGGNPWWDLVLLAGPAILEGIWNAGNALCAAAGERAASDGHVAWADVGHR